MTGKGGTEMAEQKAGTDWLMVSDLDGTLLSSQGVLSGRTRELLQQLIAQGAQISIATARTCATVVPLLAGVPLPLPAVIMNGAALYDLNRQEFQEEKPLSYPVSAAVLSIFRRHGCNCFTHVIRENGLDIFYDGLFHPAEEEFYQERCRLPLKRYRQEDLPAGTQTVYFSAMQHKPVLDAVYEEIRNLPEASQLQGSCYSDLYHPGYYFLELYRRDASKKNGVLSLRRHCQAGKVAVFGDNCNDLPMMEIADYACAVGNAVPEVRESADAVLGDHDSDAVAREMQRLFAG